MYDEYFGLKESPFDLSTDPKFLYMSPAHARARAYLDYAVYKGDGLVVISGEIGVGKSTLIHDIAVREHAHADVIVMRQPHRDIVEFLQALLLECGCKSIPDTKPELLAAVHDELTERFMWGKRTTLIIDEAQTLERPVLEELRMLADRQIGAAKPLAIVLVGQPCLRDNLSGDDLEQFRQRVRLTYHLDALDVDETRRYLEKRLDVAGAGPGPWPIFREDTISRLHLYTGGIPRLINVLADLCLTAAYLDGADSVGTEQLDSAIKELGWVPYARRRRRSSLAMPGLGMAGKVRASLRHIRARVADHCRTALERVNVMLTSVRQRGPIAIRRFGGQAQRGAGAVSSAMRRLPNQLPALAGEAKRALVKMPSAIAARVNNGPLFGANVVRGVGIVFIGLMTASVVISGNRDQRDDPALAPVQVPALGVTATGDDGTGVSHRSLAAGNDAETGGVLAGTGVSPGDEDSATAGLTVTDSTQRTDSDPVPLTGHAANTDPSTTGSRSQAPGTPVDEHPFMSMDTAMTGDTGTKSSVVKSVPSAPLATPATTSPANIKPAIEGLEGAGWLLAQQPDSYVIQVLAAKDPGVVERFLRGSARGLDLAYYRRLRDDEEWHVIVTGLYPSHAVAKQATATLPADVRKTGPWVRPISTVQDDIRAAGRDLQARVN